MAAKTSKDKMPDGQRGLNYHNGKLNNTIATCPVCDQLYDGSSIEFCPYCAYTPGQRLDFIRHQMERGDK